MEEFAYNLVTKTYKGFEKYVYPVAIASDDKLNEVCENIMASSRNISVSASKITTSSEIEDDCYLVFDDKRMKRKDKNKVEAIAILLDRPFHLYKPYSSARKRATTMLNQDEDDKFNTVIYEFKLNTPGYIVKYTEDE